MYTKITSCRICGNSQLKKVLDLGEMALSGIFPNDPNLNVEKGPLALVKCVGDESTCGLVQLQHDYDLDQLYGENYGYRSGLNQSMVKHLHSLTSELQKWAPLNKGDLVIDVGSNDSTLLRSYERQDVELVGVDPSGPKFKKYYPEYVKLIPDFFPSPALANVIGKKKAKFITSIAMFYDLPQPMAFVKAVSETLADDGVWMLEMSYLPTMLLANAYDTVCHEHLEYYSLKQIKYMTDRSGLKILDVAFNDVNGGSFKLLVAKEDSPYASNDTRVNSILQREIDLNIDSAEIFENFKNRIDTAKDQLLQFLKKCENDGKVVCGYGASTKGNVLLQYCGINNSMIAHIAEVNPDKFGCFTPGTKIPIISEQEAAKLSPDFFVVLPWHFRENILAREKSYLERGGHFYFPLPVGEIV